MQGLAFYRKLLAYDKKVLDSYLSKCAKLPWKTVSKNMESSHYSIKNTLVHILTVYNGWLNYIAYGRAKEIPHDTKHNPENYHSMKEIRKFSNEVWKGVDQLLTNVDKDESLLLSKKLKAPWLPGRHSLNDVLMQTSLEQAHHIGEIISLFWQLDIEPPEMTWLMNTRGYRG